jgi:predicted ATP-grasp superfamily ATP-dependent carboligase
MLPATERRSLQSGRWDATFALSDLGEEIRNDVGVAVPDLAALEAAHDKLELTRRAEALGIPVPITHAPRDRAELTRLAESLRYPVVYKLRRGAAAVGLGFPASAGELLQHHDGLRIAEDRVFTTDRPLIQELIPGPVHDVVALFHQGEPRAVMTQQRLAMRPARGGPGCYNQTTIDPDLAELGVTLLKSLGWHGPAMVEFKRDSRDGRFRLLEVNGRFWGTLGLAILAGIDFPWLTCRMALEGDIEPVPHYRVGVRYRWVIPEAFGRSTGVATSLRARWRALRPGHGVATEIEWSDPLPHLLEIVRARRAGP